MSVLDEIVEGVRLDLAQAKRTVPESELRSRAGGRDLPPSFRDAIAGRERGAPLRVIAEVTRASPSRGWIARSADPVRTALAYVENGAAAVSVLTERRRFGGSIESLEAVAKTVRVPVLRKDFILEPYQILEAAVAGAAAVLLIAALHERGDLYALIEAAKQVQVAALVEVHDEAELERALAAGATIIGVNNRDLRTLAVSLDASRRLAPKVPAGVLKVAESGIQTRDHLDQLRAWGYDAFLIGEHLMSSPSPGRALAQLLAPVPAPAPKPARGGGGGGGGGGGAGGGGAARRPGPP